MLKEFQGVCTYDLLHEARSEEYGDNYHKEDWGVSETPLDSIFPNLNKMCHVPKNTRVTKEFAPKVDAFVSSLLSKVKSKVEIRPLMIGSFPNDTKIGDIDAFNYLCLVPPIEGMKIIQRPTDCYAELEENAPITPMDFYECVRKILEHYNNTSAVFVSDIFLRCQKLELFSRGIVKTNTDTL